MYSSLSPVSPNLKAAIGNGGQSRSLPMSTVSLGNFLSVPHLHPSVPSSDVQIESLFLKKGYICEEGISLVKWGY